MDPRTQFYEQVDVFLEKFKNYHDWSIKKDKKNNIIIIISSELVMPSQAKYKLNGVSLQFALNVRGELAFSISVENPIGLESREAFKKKLHWFHMGKPAHHLLGEDVFRTCRI